MEEDKYIKERLDDQIYWYGQKSAVNKKYYLLLKTLSISFATLIPFLSGFITMDNFWIIYLISGLGASTAILTGLSTIFKFQEKWSKYRTTCETLKHEKYLFLTKSGPYHNERNNFENFVTKIESLISEENSRWVNSVDIEEAF